MAIKALLIIPILVCLALVLFGVGVFLAWVLGGMYVNDDLFLRSFIGAMAGGFSLFVIGLTWIDLD